MEGLRKTDKGIALYMLDPPPKTHHQRVTVPLISRMTRRLAVSSETRATGNSIAERNLDVYG